jgi:hypothetical protein
MSGYNRKRSCTKKVLLTDALIQQYYLLKESHSILKEQDALLAKMAQELKNLALENSFLKFQLLLHGIKPL